MNAAGQRPARPRLVLLGPDGSMPGADPEVFPEAVEAFRKRVPMTDEAFEELATLAHDRAFTIAGVAQLDVITDVWVELDKAVANGTTFDDFKAAVAEKLTKAWGGSNPARVENIFRTNVQGAYGAGRIKQLSAPAVLKARPFWKYLAVLDNRTSPICKAIAGTILPADDVWWGGHQPPLHFLCRGTVVPLTERQAADEGVSEEAPAVDADTGFGNAKAFEKWTPDLTQYPEPLRAAFLKKTGS